MKALQTLFFVILIALLSGCAGMNLSGGAIGKNGGGFISADGRGMQRGGHPGYNQQGYPMQQQYGQPMMVQGQPMYGQPTMVYQGQMQQYQGYPAQMYQGGYAGHGGGVQTAPCQPFNADGLMAWAQGAGPSTHSRSASVSNSNGRVDCYSSESASSYGVNKPMPTAMPVVR